MGKFMERKSKYYKYGIGFWSGAGIYSLVNLLINLQVIPHQNIVMYNFIILGVSIFGLILNIALMLYTKDKNSSTEQTSE